ncbi:MAG: amidohydrolase family protein [Pseudomonadota bacterium]
MDFIDTHQHLIWRDRFSYSWTETIPQLAGGDFSPLDYAALSEGKGIAGTVFMEAAVDDKHYRDEARFVATLVGEGGLLGQIASCRPEEDDGFDAWLEECASLKVNGLRRILHVMPDEVSQSSRFRTNLRKIGRVGLPFDLCMLARQLPLALDLVQACDEQVFVLNHCGVPDIAGDAFEDWSKGLKAVAAHSNVFVKLSGIAAYCAPHAADIKTLEPWVHHVLDSFGPKRIVWGSDWPVVNLGADLPNWIDMTRAMIGHLSKDEQLAIAQLNAKKIYNV